MSGDTSKSSGQGRVRINAHRNKRHDRVKSVRTAPDCMEQAVGAMGDHAYGLSAELRNERRSIHTAPVRREWQFMDAPG